jgi:glycosyltransferase involved in cell wall biosynthesis
LGDCVKLGGARLQSTIVDKPFDGKWKPDEPGRKVVFCVPTVTRPFQVTLDSIAASVPLLDKAGWDHYIVYRVGCPYISAARSEMLRKALDAKADVIVFIDHDLSWEPSALLKLIETEGDVVAGTYRFKREPEEYMGGLLPGLDKAPQVRADGAVKAFCIPAGFLKITRNTVNKFIDAYPGLCYGDRFAPHIDLFNHGAHGGVWYGEDYAFSRNWIDAGGEIWIVPDLNLHHHSADAKYEGNYHRFLLRQPGGSDDPDREAA